MRRFELVLCVLGLATLACNLGSAAGVATTQPSPTRTVSSVGLPASATVPAPVTPSSTPCAVRSDWSIYTVASGDTLSDIAERTESTLSDLSLANCLSNPDSIYPGQQLRVPRQPVPKQEPGAQATVAPQQTPTPTSCPDTLPTRLNNSLGAIGRVRIPPAAGSQITSLPMGTEPSIRAGRVIGYIPDGAVFNIVGGPFCGEATIWWQINYNSLIGWVQETAGTNYYWLEPVANAP